MKRYQMMKLKIFETDKNGTITVKTDGKAYSIVPETGDAQ
jgi:competence protein ComEC